MSLSDIMSHMRLDTYAVVAIILFLAAFAAIAVNALARRREDTARCAALPLDDADTPAPTAGTTPLAASNQGSAR